MGEEIEIFILKKLDDAIEESKVSSEFHFAARLFLPKLHKEFSELKKLIEEKRAKIKLAAAAVTGPSNAPRPRPAVRDPAGNDSKIPDASKPSVPSSSAVTGGAATAHDSSIRASTSAGGAKEDSKVPLPAGGVQMSEVPLPAAAGDDKEKGAPKDVGDEKGTGASLAGGVDEKDTGAPLDAGDEKELSAPLDVGDDKVSGAPRDAGDDKESVSDAGDKKESGAPSDVGDIGDKKETEAPLDTSDKKEMDASSDTSDKKEMDAPLNAVGGDKKEIDAPSDVVAGDKKESSAPSDASDEKETSAPLVDSAEKEPDSPLATTSSKTTSPDEAKASTPATASVTSGGATDHHELDTHTSAAGGGKKESNVGTSVKTISQDESEISPAIDTMKGDESITPAASASDADKEAKVSKSVTFAKTSSLGESEISPVTDDDATDHKSKTLPTSAGSGKKESGLPPAGKSSTTDAGASSKSDSNTVVIKPVNEEDLLREQLYYLNNVLTEWEMITKKPFSYSSDSVSSIKDLSKTLKKIKQVLKPETTKKTDESSPTPIPPTGLSEIKTTPEVADRWSTRLVNLEKVHGFQDKILSLERLLVLRRKDTDAFKAFGLHGMAGVGKTTLCQSIFSRPKVSEYFFPRIWVCLSKQGGEDEDNRKEVVKRMLRCLGIDDKIINKVDEKQSIRGLLFALRLQLTGKRYFIVLDDAHNVDKWFKMPDSDAENDNNKDYEKFSYGLPKECGGTVIVTSRVEQVVKNMVGDEENLRCIEPLTDQDTCWNIFKDTVMEDGTPFPEDLNKLRAEIVKRCDGLPLAAKLLGEIKHKELRHNPTAAVNQRSAVQAGNQQAAVQAGIQQAAVQAAQ